MPSLFSRIDKVASATVDRVWREGWRLYTAASASLDPDAPRSVDLAGPYIDLQGVYVTEVGDLITPNAHDLRMQHRPGMTVGHPAVDIDIRTADFTVNRNDQLVRVDDGTRWRIVDIRPDVDGRRRLILNGIA